MHHSFFTGSGFWADQAYDSLISDEYEDGEDYYVGKKSTSCKYCGSLKVKWVQYEQGWRLTDTFDDTLHHCDAYTKTKEKE